MKLKVKQCDNIKMLMNRIDECNICMFSKSVDIDKSYICEGVEIKTVEDKLDVLHRYALELGKKIGYI